MMEMMKMMEIDGNNGITEQSTEHFQIVVVIVVLDLFSFSSFMKPDRIGINENSGSYVCLQFRHIGRCTRRLGLVSLHCEIRMMDSALAWHY